MADTKRQLGNFKLLFFFFFLYDQPSGGEISNFSIAKVKNFSYKYKQYLHVCKLIFQTNIELTIINFINSQI